MRKTTETPLTPLVRIRLASPHPKGARTWAVVPLMEAAKLAMLPPHEVDWALEEHGKCDTDDVEIRPVR